MLTGISWKEYLVVMALIAFFYYSYVLLRYYLQDLQRLVRQKRLPQVTSESALTEQTPVDQQLETATSETPVAVSESDFSALDTSRLDELIEGIQRAFKGDGLEKLVDMIAAVGDLLLQYPDLRNSAYRSSINEFIISEGEKYGHVMPSEAEIDVLWDERA